MICVASVTYIMDRLNLNFSSVWSKDCYFLAFKGIVIQSFDTKKTQNGVNKYDKIMHLQRGKRIFTI